MKIVPYLIFAGKAEEAINFYVESLNGSIIFLNRFSDAPMPSEEEQKNKILHSSFMIGESTVMASDGKPHEQYSGNNVSLSLDFSDVDDMKQKFEKLSAGGNVTMPVQDTFWGATFGMLVDKYGISWMFNCDKKTAAATTSTEEKTLDITD